MSRGEFDLPERLTAQLALLTPVDHVRLALSIALKVVAAVLLFRMRKWAAHLFTVALALGFFGWLGRLAVSGAHCRKPIRLFVSLRIAGL